MPTPLEPPSLELLYQPVVDLARREVVALEVVLQSDDPRPDVAAVLEQACGQAAVWDRRGLAVEIGVNVTLAQVLLPGYTDHVRRCLESSGLPASRLTVEVGEPELADDPSAEAALRELSALGVTVALDDFGTGSSSLMHLRRYPVRQLKIDASFVAGLGRRHDDAAIVSSIISLGGVLGVACVAQGVDADLQVTHLLELGCARAQGSLFSPPVAAAQVPAAIDVAEGWAARQPTRAAVATQVAGPTREAVPDDVLLHMQQMRDAGGSSATIAAALNQRGSRHPSGRQWHRTSVARFLAEACASRAVSA